MALINLDFYSKELMMSTLVTMIVPDAARIKGKPLSQHKCLYLLHGLSDDSTAWLRFTKIELYAQEAGLVVVMPSVGRSMYCDGVNGQNYFSHVADELPEYLNLVFGLSRKREDNCIAGISMGGMGAARIALTYPERYKAAGLFSGLLDTRLFLPMFEDPKYRTEFPFMEEVLTDPDKTVLNPVNLLDRNKHAGLQMVVRVGAEDDLYPMSVSFINKAKELGLDITGILEKRGGHQWREWDRYIDDFIREYV